MGRGPLDGTGRRTRTRPDRRSTATRPERDCCTGTPCRSDGPLTSRPMPRAEATGDSGRRANWQARSRRHRRYVRQRVRPTGVSRHRDHGALCGERSGEGSAVPLHRLQGGAPRRHPRQSDGRSDARRRSRRRRGRLAVDAVGHARRRAARRDPPLPGPCLGLPPRFSRAHGGTGRTVPRAAARRTSGGWRRSSRPAWIRANSGRSNRG